MLPKTLVVLFTNDCDASPVSLAIDLRRRGALALPFEALLPIFYVIFLMDSFVLLSEIS
jgi:hypothetical protein